LPNVFEVTRQVAGNDVDDVDPHLLRLAEETRHQQLGCRGYPAQAVVIKRVVGSRKRGTGLDLDEGQHLAAPGDQVDLSYGSADALAEDTPALAAQVPGCDCFGSPPAPLRFGACLGQREISKARS
jgi:hypothetical protein